MRDELFDVSDKICIVTGGLGQIGKNLARGLYERGARVAIFAAHPTPERVESIFPAAQYQAGRLQVYQVDINRKETIEAALDQMEALWKDAPDVLVNCAGIDTQPSAPPEVSGPFEKFAEAVSRETGLPVLCHAVERRLLPGLTGLGAPLFPITIPMKKPRA